MEAPAENTTEKTTADTQVTFNTHTSALCIEIQTVSG